MRWIDSGRKKRFSFREKLLLLFFLIVFVACTVWLIAYHVSAAENEAQMVALQNFSASFFQPGDSLQQLCMELCRRSFESIQGFHCFLIGTRPAAV